MVNAEKIIDQIKRPIDRRVARPFIKIVADRKRTKKIMLSKMDIESLDVRRASKILDNSHEKAMR